MIKAGTVIIQEGEVRQTDYMLLVLEGDIAVENELPGLHESMVVNIMGPGHLIGEMGVLDGAPRSATCTANTNIAVAVLSRTALMRMADRLRETTRKLKTFAQMNKALQQELQVVMNTRSPLEKRRGG